ncbi:MAG: DUF362 domain-containing protein [Endomicrobiales bacterium]|nr:DUF362 domain-containing protein [Endomicrobiales bacterium]
MPDRIRFLDRAWGTVFTRKSFLKFMGALVAFIAGSRLFSGRALAVSGRKLAPRPGREVSTAYDLAVAEGKNPGLITRKAVDALGGMKKFVKPGDIVVVKPNIGWDRGPEQAACTNPEVVGELVKMCFEAGAKVVKVFDNTCNSAKRTYENSGISGAAKKAGATVFYVSDWKFYPARMPADYEMADWPIYEDAVKCDCFINVPVAKHHGLSQLTLSLKNLMGVCGGSRGRMHWGIERKLAELAWFIKPDLNVIDANRILLRHGPTGGNLADVEERNTVIVSTDPVLCDAYAATLFDFRPQDIRHIKEAAAFGVGSMDIKSAKIKNINA